MPNLPINFSHKNNIIQDNASQALVKILEQGKSSENILSIYLFQV